MATDGGYILDASAIMQNDTKVENILAMTDFVRDYGVYSGSSGGSSRPIAPTIGSPGDFLTPGKDITSPIGGCVSWKTKQSQLPELSGDKELFHRIWNQVDGLANVYIWQLLLSF